MKLMKYYFYFLAYDTAINPTKWRVDYEENYEIHTGIGNTQGIAVFRSHISSLEHLTVSL